METMFVTPGFVTYGAAMVFAVSLLSAGPPHQDGGYPEHKKRNVYAKNDLRGMAGPAVVAERWLQAMPDAKNKVVVVHFFRTACAPCGMVAESFNAWQSALKGDVVFVGVTAESEESARYFVRRYKPRYAIGSDSQRRTLEGYGDIGYPFVAVLSPDGVVRWQGWPTDREDPLDLATLKHIVAASKKR